MVWRRARSEEQREQRRQVLLAAAARLYAAHPIQEVSLSAIAREANISKANIYRYFESREDLFLQLVLDSLESWSESLTRRLDSLDPPATAQAVARVFSETATEHGRFARLSSVLSTVLEHNVSTEGIVRFKTRFVSFLPAPQEAVQRALGNLGPEAARHVLEVAYFLMAGLWPASHPPPELRVALNRAGLESVCIDFEARLTDFLSVSIRGLRAGSATSSPHPALS